ncbi:MAG: U1 snRNP-associated protein usp107 [Lasallia pustulata]|uniref:U1 snRNP-associated protein usp107 n=1 Tax=Lasallia pustulata TaxID=136370 RepID=A0A5M8PZA0_9LECA|nr:MAG: U1 snRNP-associated protein usp107 [Lasallia pustulata]
MYNQYPGSTPFGRPPGFGAFPGQSAPPGMGAPPVMAPPGMSAPGVSPAPGMQQANSQQPGRPGGFPGNFQPPANMPNINFSAPVIRLGTSGPNKPLTPLGGDSSRRESNVEPRSARPGLGAGQGMEAQRQAVRESMMQLVPPTKEEIVRTIFVGGITEGAGGDEGVERILRCAGNLRRWTRAMDADNKACRFGFAEYEDPESLATAVDVLKDVEVPLKKQTATNGTKKEEDDGNAKVEKGKLLIFVDDNSLNYLEQYQASRGDQDPIQGQLRLDAAKSALASVLADLANPTIQTQNHDLSGVDRDGDISMQNGEKEPEAEIVTISLTVDDELSDIPAEMRETVAKEIAAFRDRSNRRDMERLKREEEIEALERQRNLSQPRPNRLASPPPTAPIGPGGGANGIPLGPKERGVPNAPAGPKGYTGSQLPRDYQKGVTFVNGSGVNGAASAGWINREDEDSDASDEDLERRRNQKKEAELEKLYLDQERRWLNRERSRTAAVEREKARDREEEAQQAAEKEAVAKRLREWNDDTEATRKVEEYYLDRSLWVRNRATFRTREAHLDDLDRAAEERDKTREQQQRDQARGLADDFLNRQAAELDSKAQAPREPQRFKLSLGAAAQKAQAASSAGRRTVAEVEGLLEDEEEADASARRTLVPITFDSAAEAAGLSDEERALAVRQLAADIPSDREGLWKWPVRWEFVDETVLGEQLRPFVEKKIVEYLGVQEQMLVEVVEEHVRKRGGPTELVEQLEGALDEEAEVLVKKLWRMIIFFSESEKRGLSA